jgi:hypothetical protein
MKLLLAYHDTNSKSCSESRFKFLFRLSFVLNGQFFPVYIPSRHLEQFSESQAGFGTTFIATGGHQKSGILQLISDVIEASRNFSLDFQFLHRMTTENCENHKRSF